MQASREEERQDQVVIEMLERLKGKVDYAPLRKRLRQHPVIFLHELDRFFTKKQIPLIIRDLETINIPIVCVLEIRNLGPDRPGVLNEGIIHYQPQTLSDLLCTWLEVTLGVSMPVKIANGADSRTRQRTARFWRLYLYKNMDALLHKFSRWS